LATKADKKDMAKVVIPKNLQGMSIKLDNLVRSQISLISGISSIKNTDATRVIKKKTGKTKKMVLTALKSFRRK
jgi:hypothetical protein